MLICRQYTIEAPVYKTKLDLFPADINSIAERIDQIDPANYARTRNYKDGAVTRLSPYISRGVISTKKVFQALLAKGYRMEQMYKYIQELAWRDYWQQIWVHEGEAINEDLRQPQTEVENHQMPLALYEGKTGILAIDKAIESFYDSGYIHNHMRLYMASLACNMGKSHWLLPARWMYYHLLDGDWASNALSWQWVCGSNSKKKYLANQDNINKFFYTNQKGTFLDLSYEALSSIEIPEVLRSVFVPELLTHLPESDPVRKEEDLPVIIYNSYNLDPDWKKDMSARRILLLEPSHFEKYPISAESLQFILDLSRNIPGIQIFTGEFESLSKQTENKIFFKEHPLNKHYRGIEEPRDWMFDVQGSFTSFFAFWKKCERFLRNHAQ